MKQRLSVLALALALLLTSCGGGTSAATMHLRKTEGTVGVSDGAGKDVAVKDDLGLHSGYQVGTQSESYAWIDLDSVKLTKLDEDSQVEIAKDGKKLEINVTSGSLFFNVTEPLADDETMDIRISTMAVGIRGTCGWVTQDAAALLEGTVEVTAGDQTATVTAGEMAVLKASGELEVRELYQEDVPAFVLAELAGDDGLTQTVEQMEEARDPMAAYETLLNMTPDVLYTELIDFEQDGDPELLMITGPRPSDDPHLTYVSVDIWIWRGTEEGTALLTGTPVSLHAGSKVSLAESGGQLFLHTYTVQYFYADWYNYHDEYIGSVARENGGQEDWGIVDSVGIDTSLGYSILPHMESGHEDRGAWSETTAEVVEAVQNRYTDLRDLVISDDGVNVTVGNP